MALSAQQIMDDVCRAFAREAAKRQIEKTDDVETLRACCLALIEANNSMRDMLADAMREKLPGYRVD